MDYVLLRSPELGRSAPKMRTSDATYGMNPGLYLGITLDRFPDRPCKPLLTNCSMSLSDNNSGMKEVLHQETQKKAGIPPFGEQNEQNLVSR